MKKPARRVLRKILKLLTRALLKKHNPTIIALVGESGTSLPREVLYHTLHKHFPTRRNIESPEAEFVVPLTIVGAERYPQDLIEWLELVLKTLVQLIVLPAHSNILILEMNTGLPEILNYWLEITNPEYVITCGTHPPTPYLKERNLLQTTPAVSADLEIYKELAVKIGTSLGLEKETVEQSFSNINLPEPRIRLLPGSKGNFVVDATYKYFPPLKQSLEEVLRSLSGKKLWIRSPEDWEHKKLDSQEVVVIWGPRKELLPVLEEAALNPLGIPNET